MVGLVLLVVAPGGAVEGGLVAAPLRHALLHVVAVVTALRLLESADEALHGRGALRLLLLEALRGAAYEVGAPAAAQVLALGLRHAGVPAGYPRPLVHGALVVVHDGGLDKRCDDLVAVRVGVHSVLGHPGAVQVHVRALVPEHVEHANRRLQPILLGDVVQRHVQGVDVVSEHAVRLFWMPCTCSTREDGRYGHDVDLRSRREVLEERDQTAVVLAEAGLEVILQGVAGTKLHEDYVGQEVLHSLKLLPLPDACSGVFQDRDIRRAVVVHAVGWTKQLLQLGWEWHRRSDPATHDRHISLGHAGAHADDLLARDLQAAHLLDGVPRGAGQALLAVGREPHHRQHHGAGGHREVPPRQPQSPKRRARSCVPGLDEVPQQWPAPGPRGPQRGQFPRTCRRRRSHRVTGQGLLQRCFRVL
mmetsp:Transcript_46115/g.123879  ORF Transcript_46115/g.123879 Transcript_46115/m.123879 type:complete len:418 (-) Transcript_46115:59-1312(-)